MSADTNPSFITIVSGLPRSGTSMMMRMLTGGGLEAMQDGERAADEDNPKGYFEFERVKQIRTDQAWLPDAAGKVVKAISLLLMDMPAGYEYRVVFMDRAIPEVLASQRKMLVRRGENPDATADEKMTVIYEKHLAQVKKWIDDQPNVSAVYVPYHEVIADPATHASRVNAHLGNILDEANMVAAVDPSLYRNRKV